MLYFITNYFFWILEAVDHIDNYKPLNLRGPPIQFDLKLFLGVIVMPVDQLGEEIELLSRIFFQAT